MEVKDFIGLTLLGIAACGSAVLASLSRRAREAMFMFLVIGTVETEKMDINFASRYWYRGTTRGFEFTLLDAVAAGLIIGLLLNPEAGSKRWYWPASLGALLLYFTWAAISVVISDPKVFGMFELSRILRSILIFLTAAFFVRGEHELALLAFALGCAVCLEGALALKQHYLDGLYRAAGSLDHPNSLSVFLCMAAPVMMGAACAPWQPWLARFCGFCVAISVVAVLLTVSRAGIPIVGVVLLGAMAFSISWHFSASKIGIILLGAAGLTAFAYQAKDRLLARFAETSLAEEYSPDHFEGRGSYLLEARAILDDRLLGVGLNNWSYWVSKKYGGRVGFHYEDYDDLANPPAKEELQSYAYAAPAHNLAALTAGELGVPGLLIFGFVWWRWFQIGAVFLKRKNAIPMRTAGVGLFFAVVGIFSQNLFEWVYRQTQILFLFHILLGALASLYAWHRHNRLAHS